MKFKATMRHHFTPISMAITKKQKLTSVGTSLVVQWLRLHASTAGGMRLTSGWGSSPHASWSGQKKKKKEEKERKKLQVLVRMWRNGNLIYCWWKCKIVQLLYKIV